MTEKIIVYQEPALISRRVILRLRIKLMTRLLTLSGEDEGTALSVSKKIFALETELSENSLDPEEYYDIEKTYHVYTLEQLDSLYPNFDIKKTITDTGYQLPESGLGG